MAEKIGVYICEGCDIGENLDCGALAEFISNKFGDLTPVVTTHPILCSAAGKAAIQADIDAGTIEAVSVCACSPRAKWDVFNFGDKILVDRVNLREQCVWANDGEGGDGETDGTTLMARDYTVMGVHKLNKSDIPNPEIPETVKTIMVLGGGFAGLTAAINAAKAGSDVVLVEKDAELGGFAAKMYKTVPLTSPWTDAHDTGIKDLIAEVQGDARIKVITGTTLQKLVGAPGMYEARLSNGSSENIGAVVVATGWVPQDMSVFQRFGYGKYDNVITSMDMEEMAGKGQLLRPSDGKPVTAVAFVTQCPDCWTPDLLAPVSECSTPEEETKDEGEDEDKDTFVPKDHEGKQHLSMASGISNIVALKQANYVTELAKDAVAYVLYENMTVPGLHELYYKSAQDEPGVMLSKGDIGKVDQDADGSLLVTVNNSLIGGDIELKVDLVVLSVGLIPTTGKEPIINLEYRQGPAFPDLELFEGFADSNYICFPYETRRTGVYATGTVRQPMLMDQIVDDATGAALKAIQCVHSINRGMSVHPRSGDLSFPDFNFVRCTQCKRCTEECPFGALDDDEKGTPKPNPTRCRRCGTCMGACPERVIKFANYNVDQVGTMLKSIYVPNDMATGGPRVVVLACENDAYPALDMAAVRGHKWSPYVRIVPVRCLGSVNAIWVADAMSKGVDGVMLLGCKYGDDYQCHFVKGSELCNRRKENIAETLGRLGIEADRVEQYEVSIDEYDKVPDLIGEFMDSIIEKGPNPFKGY